MRIGVSALALRGRREKLDSGVARYCAGLIEAWVADPGGYEFVVWVSPQFEVPAEWREQPAIEWRMATGRWARYKTLWELLAGGKASTDSRCDVWFSTAHALPAGVRVATVLSVQDLFTFSHPQFYTMKHRLVIGWAMRRALAQADRLVAISEHTRGELGRRFAIDAERVTVTRLGLSNVGPAVSAAGVEASVERAPYLLTLSTVEPRKNLGRLFEAFARLIRRPEHATLRLVVAGSKGWKTAPIYRRPQELGIADRIDFVGFVPDDQLPALFAGCAAFVLPSIIEGFGLPLLEAMAFGAPAVCSNAGSLPEVGGDVPTYFDPLDVEAMEAALHAELSSSRPREQRAGEGKLRAAGFSWRETAEQTLEALSAAVESR